MIYFTAGLAYGNVNDTLQYNSNFFPTFNTPYFNVNTTRFGWVVGAGVEYAVTQNWTIKGEALYADLSNANASWIFLLPVRAPFLLLPFISDDSTPPRPLSAPA